MQILDYKIVLSIVEILHNFNSAMLNDVHNFTVFTNLVNVIPLMVCPVFHIENNLIFNMSRQLFEIAQPVHFHLQKKFEWVSVT